MAVYEANIRSLAEFISDTKLGFIPCEVESTTGYRINGESSNYIISVHERIYVVNDCFIDLEGNIVVVSYIPAIKYHLISNELSTSYRKWEHVPFEYKTDSKVLRYEIEKDIELKTYDDFENCMEDLVRYIGQNLERDCKETITCEMCLIEEMINEFKNSSWRIDNVVCNIEWQVDKIKKF